MVSTLWLWYLSHRRPAKAQASLRIRAVSPEPSLFAHMKNGSRRRVRPKLSGWLKNVFTEDEKCHNLESWLNYLPDLYWTPSIAVSISFLFVWSSRCIGINGIRLKVITPTLVLSGPIDNTWTIDLAKLFIMSKFWAPTLLDMSRTNTISARVPLQSVKRHQGLDSQ